LRSNEAGERQRPDKLPSVGGGPTAREEDQQRKEYVELLFYRQGPGMELWIAVQISIEISALAVEEDVGQEENGSDDRLCDFGGLIGHQQAESGQHHAKIEREQRRENTFDATFVEIEQRVAPSPLLAQQCLRDQIAGDDKKDVDPDEAAGKEACAQMKDNDRKDSHGSQPVNIRAILLNHVQSFRDILAVTRKYGIRSGLSGMAHGFMTQESAWNPAFVSPFFY
jgi:hypothetical protein